MSQKQRPEKRLCPGCGVLVSNLGRHIRRQRCKAVFGKRVGRGLK